jgi:uncharacterized protein
MFWHEEQALIMSDLHIGKVTHFRKNGVAAPTQLIQKEYELLGQLFTQWQPKKWIITGDLFHSNMNNEWLLFTNFIQQFQSTEIILIRGNHDTFPAYVFKNAHIKVQQHLLLEPFVFCHQPFKHHQFYCISGHIHPAITLGGKAKQRVTVPCYYFGQNFALMPAFGNFTGLQTITPQTNDSVFGIAGNEVIKIV